MLRFFILLCFFIKTVNAQEHKIVTNKELERISFDSLKNAFHQYRYSKPQMSKMCANAYYNKAIKENDITKMGIGAHQYALIYNILGQKDSALYFVDVALEKSKRIDNDQYYASSLYLKGNIYYVSTSYTKAIEYYTKAYDVIKKENDSFKLAKISNSISLIKSQIGERKQALTLVKNNLLFYEQLYKEKSSLNINTDYINALLNISNIYTNLYDDDKEYKKAYLDSALIYSSKGSDKSLTVNDDEAYAMFLTLQGIIHQKKGNFEKAIKYLKKAEEKIIKLEIINELPVLYMYQGKNYFLQQYFDTALPYFLKVDSIVNKNNLNSVSLQENYILLAQCYEQKKDIDKALYYHNIFKNKDALSDEVIVESLQKMYKEYDVVAFKARIDKLTKASTKEKNRAALLKKISFALLGLIVLGIMYYYKVRQDYKKRFNTIIEEINSVKEKTKKQTLTKVTTSYQISDENIDKILNGLEIFEKEKKFLMQKCSINFVAKEINTNTTYLSKTLQSHKQKKFVQYITDLRIDYALLQLKEHRKFRAYDIKSIALELGFNTSESFSKAFKKKTGIYPSFYIKKLNSMDT